MFSKQVVLTGVIGAAIVCVLSVPVISAAGESQVDVREAQNVEAIEEHSAGATGESSMPDLKHAGKSDPKEKKEDKDKADKTGDKADSGNQETRKVAHTLTAVRPRVSEETIEQKKEPLPDDAIIGVKSYKRRHLDIPTERLIASIGEQARYIGLKDGIPASILIADTINVKGTHLSADTPYRVYGSYIESRSRNLANVYEKHSGAKLAEGISYNAALDELVSQGALSQDDASSIADLIKRYELYWYDEPLSYTVTGRMYDENLDKNRDMQYSDYVNLERIATSYIGTPYVWGGNSELTGFDCSGLVQWTYEKALGITLPRTTYIQQYIGESIPVDIDELRMGDLLFFYTPSEGTHHVAMYLADGYYIHAPCSGDVVKITSIEEFAPTFARRVVTFEKA